MDHNAFSRLLGVGFVAGVCYFLYQFEFQLKTFWRSRKCAKSGHLWTTVYSLTQQCRRCHKVREIPKEVYCR